MADEDPASALAIAAGVTEIKTALAEIAKIATKNSFRLEAIVAEHANQNIAIQKLYKILVEGNGQPSVLDRVGNLENEVVHISEYIGAKKKEEAQGSQNTFNRNNMYINTVITMLATIILTQFVPPLFQALKIVLSGTP